MTLRRCTAPAPTVAPLLQLARHGPGIVIPLPQGTARLAALAVTEASPNCHEARAWPGHGARLALQSADTVLLDFSSPRGFLMHRSNFAGTTGHLTGFPRTALAWAAAAAFAVAASAVVAPAWAQNTTSALSGRVVATDGRPLAGVTVTILHRESGSTVSTTTDATGRYAARGLRVGGPFLVTFTRGASTERRDNIFLTLAETTDLDMTLREPAAQTITVTGSAERINRSAMGAGTNVSNRELNTYASIQRSLQDVAVLDPRLSQTDKERGEISAGGQNTRFNKITIDGVTINDTFGLEANNLPTIKQPISIDAIQSVQINLSNYDVTQTAYTGANINAVTKSGTNDFKGSVYYVFRTDDLVGQRYNRTTQTYFDPAGFKESTRGFTLGGPIIKDKLFFFGTYEILTSSRASPDFGPLGSSRTNVGITQNAIDQAISIARNTWGMDVGSSEIPQGLQVRVEDTLLKLDWNISDNHRANLRYTKTEQTEPNIVGFSATGLSLSSWWYNQTKDWESVVGQWFADWSPDLATELKISKRDYASSPTPVNGQRLPAIGLRFSGALPPGSPTGVNANNRFLNIGTELSRHFNVLETQTTDVYFGTTWTRGDHELKFGADYANNEIYNAFLQNVNGNYTFGCEPGTYSFGTFTSCDAMTAAQREAATLENFRLGRASAYTVQLPLAGRTLADGVAIWSVANTGLFLQDTWKVSRNLNVMLGLRVDQQNVPEAPLANALAAAPRVAGSISGTTITRDSGGFGLDNTVTLDGSRLVQPRASFNWNLGTREQQMQLRGGFGLFQGAAANVWLSNPFSNTGRAVGQLNCASFTACASARFSPDISNQPGLTGTPPAPNVDFISSALEQPSVWKANLAIDADLPELPLVGRLTGTFEWLHTKTNKGIYYQHLNLGNPTATGRDGRQLFYTPNAYNMACWSGTTLSTTGTTCTGARNRALSNPSFGTNILLALPTDQGGGDQFTVGVSRPARQGFGWGLYYTRTNAKEVSPLTSSTSNSNWNGRNIFNPNEEVLQNSNYLVRDRVNGNLSFSRNFFGSNRTTFGVFYEGRRGKPYSWTFINDLNGDAINGNDLMYIPTAPGSGEVTFRGGATEEARFWEIVEANPALRAAKGGIVGRNNQFAPWVNNINLRVAQELPGFVGGHKLTLVMDILNFGNMLNKRWGRIDEIGFPSNRSFVNFNGLDANGRYIYSLGTLEDFVTRQTTGESQWAIQFTVRYEF
jgi:hypothetical protein